MKTADPELQSRPGCREKAFPLVRLELLSEGERRQLRGVQDFVGVGVANAAEQARIGEGERAVGKIERGQILSATQLGIRRLPVQSAGDHQVQYQPEITFQSKCD